MWLTKIEEQYKELQHDPIPYVKLLLFKLKKTGENIFKIGPGIMKFWPF